MSADQLRDDQGVVRALDDAVSDFKATLGHGSREEQMAARTKVYEALLRCVFRAAAIRGERARGN